MNAALTETRTMLPAPMRSQHPRARPRSREPSWAAPARQRCAFSTRLSRVRRHRPNATRSIGRDTRGSSGWCGRMQSREGLMTNVMDLVDRYVAV
jgi:hypothetical protein